MQRTLPAITDMLARLIAVPSVSSVNPQFDQGNRVVSELLAGWLDDLGFRVELLPVGGAADKVNLVATRGEGDGGLVLAGHSDTVPCDAHAWRSDPFALTERDGRLYGLGASDMKGFFPLALAAIAGLGQAALTRPLVVLATADEESGMAGARALLAGGRRPGRHAVIGEPTGLRPVRAHKGVMMESIRVRGCSGHASDPTLGRSALEGMHRVIGALLEWRGELQARFRDPAFAVSAPTVNLGCIRGGDNPNRICGECELQIDLRLLPSMAFDAVRAELGERVAAALAGSGLDGELVALLEPVPPLATAADAPLVQAVERLTGSPAGTVAFASEGPYLAALGMDAVLLGPGDIACAHQPDEHLARERFEPAIDLLGRLIHDFCMEDGDGR